MPENKESVVLEEVYQDVRGLTNFYLSKVPDELDTRREYVVEGKKMNSLYWLVGHLAWSQNFLILRGIAGEGADISWIERFDDGIDVSDPTIPSDDEVMEAFEAIHEKSMRVIRSLTEAQLEEPNLLGLNFRSGNSKRAVIRHAIRHEPFHTGQIGWLLKINGIATV